MKKSKYIIVTLLILSMFLLAGCEEVQLFEKKVDPNALAGLKDTELKDDVYYVKDGTKFYKVYNSTKGNTSFSTTALNESRVMVTMQDDSLIPTHYSDELIAMTSETIDFNYVTLERFYDRGYSIGCFAGQVMVDNSLYIKKQSGVVPGSSFFNAIGETHAEDIRIASIDGIPLAEDNVYKKAGIITGLEKEKEYTIGFYVGTKYQEEQVKADCRMYTAFELFDLGSEFVSDTQNGYRAFKMPDYLKSGYYNINGAGLYRYYDFEKGSANESNTDMNVSYYESEKARLEAYSRQYKVSVPKRAKDLKITVTYDTPEEDTLQDSIQGVLYSPDNVKIDMTVNEKDNTISVSLAEAMAGDWTINIVPKTLYIQDVQTESDETIEDATCEETNFEIPEDRENTEFIAEYELYDAEKRENHTMYGTIMSEDGQVYEMQTNVITEDDKVKYYIYYEIPYVYAGSYTVRIYHLPEETKVGEVKIQDKKETDTDVIVIDG